MAARVTDVTWVDCANREDIAALDAKSRRCLHPEYVPHPWARKGDITHPSAFAMANGTLSLALKHQLAARDIRKRGVRAALVLEDDALVPPDLWRRLGDLAVPADADVFYLGSFSSRASIGTVDQEPLALRAPAAVHRRTPGGKPLLIGANAYILFAKAAAAMLRDAPVSDAAEAGRDDDR